MGATLLSPHESITPVNMNGHSAIVLTYATNADKRFWSYVAIREKSQCWQWLRGAGDGYGKFSYTPPNEKSVITGAHRYAYRNAIGAIPPGFFVRHLCHNRSCVNPYHLGVGTAAENSADTRRAGRNRNQWTGKLKRLGPMPIAFFRWCAGCPESEVQSLA